MIVPIVSKVNKNMHNTLAMALQHQTPLQTPTAP